MRSIKFETFAWLVCVFVIGSVLGMIIENYKAENKAMQSAPVRERVEVLADKINILKQNGYTPEQAIHIAMVEANLKPVDDKYVSYITQ